MAQDATDVMEDAHGNFVRYISNSKNNLRTGADYWPL
jgi:hypothetical protein